MLRKISAVCGKIGCMKKKRDTKRPVLKLKNPCNRKRGARKVAANTKVTDRLLDACAQILAENRNAYFDGLLAIWERAINRIDSKAEHLFKAPFTPLNAADPISFIKPFDDLAAKLHIRLAGTLDETEARVFELREKRLSAAWQKFAETLKMRRPDIKQSVDDMRDDATELVSSFAGKFLGRTPPAITEKDVDLRNNLHQALKWLSEGESRP